VTCLLALRVPPPSPVLPVLHGTPARMSHDYVRHGTTTLFAALDVTSGSVIAHHYGGTATRSSCGS
jgi:hypothetical protein